MSVAAVLIRLVVIRNDSQEAVYSRLFRFFHEFDRLSRIVRAYVGHDHHFVAYGGGDVRKEL